MEKPIANHDWAKAIGRGAECLRRLADAGLPLDALQHPIDDPEFREHLVRFWKTKGFPTATTSTKFAFVAQTRRLWDLGFGRELGYKTLDSYRKSVEVELANTSERPDAMPKYLNRVILWDQRPVRDQGEKCIQLEKLARLVGVRYNRDVTDGDRFVNSKHTPVIQEPVRFVWCQTGWRNRQKDVLDYHEFFESKEYALEAAGGLFLYAQDEDVVGWQPDGTNYKMELRGSVGMPLSLSCAILQLLGAKPPHLMGEFLQGNPTGGSDRGVASRWE